MNVLIVEAFVHGPNHLRTKNAPSFDSRVKVVFDGTVVSKFDLSEPVFVNESLRLQVLAYGSVHAGLLENTLYQVEVEFVHVQFHCIKTHVDLGDHFIEGSERLVGDLLAAEDVQVVEMGVLAQGVDQLSHAIVSKQVVGQG